MHLYERIYADLKLSIEEGEARPGERLPSIRELAARYGCNKLTVQRAFELLEEAGLAENLVGSGSFVTYPRPPEERAGDFSAARLSEDFFPYEEAGRLLASILAEERGHVFSASAGRGEAKLRSALARRFSLPAESLTVLGGGQQGLDLCRRLFGVPAEGRGAKAGEGRLAFLVEEPSYPAVISLFKPSASLPLGADGPEPEAFAAFFSSRPEAATRVFYAMPELHNPTGLSYSEEKKRAIASLARELDVYLIEDDYLSELEGPLSPSGPLVHSPRFVDLAPERTLWLKSLSKTTAPGLRIGVLSAPPALLPRLDAIRAEVDPEPATWLQLFAATFLDSELFDSHLAACVAVASRRRAELEALLASFPWLSFDPASRGFNLWLKSERPLELPSPPWAPGRAFGLGASLKAYLRLSFMAMGEAEWPSALSRLERALLACGPAAPGTATPAAAKGKAK